MLVQTSIHPLVRYICHDMLCQKVKKRIFTDISSQIVFNRKHTIIFLLHAKMIMTKDMKTNLQQPAIIQWSCHSKFHYQPSHDPVVKIDLEQQRTKQPVQVQIQATVFATCHDVCYRKHTIICLLHAMVIMTIDMKTDPQQPAIIQWSCHSEFHYQPSHDRSSGKG